MTRKQFTTQHQHTTNGVVSPYSPLQRSTTNGVATYLEPHSLHLTTNGVQTNGAVSTHTHTTNGTHTVAIPRERISDRVRTLPASGIRRFFDILASMPNVISLGVGEPDFITPDHIRAAGKASIDKTTSYTSNSGIFELREAVANHLARRYDVHYDPAKEILMTVGVSEGMQSSALSVLNPGDEVIVPEPCFVAYPAAVIMADAVPVYVPTYASEAFQVTAEAIEQVITPRTRALLIGYPNNPTGAVISRDGLLAIADIAERYDLLVLSDEIYDRLVYGVEHVCFSALPGMKERTILMGGFSKAYAMTGWRLAWLAAPADIIDATTRVHQYAIMSAPTMSQYAALEALQHGEESVQQMVAEYDRRRRVIVNGFNTIGLPTFEPQGAFYAFPQISHLGISSNDFAERLLHEEHVAVIPGGPFGASGEGYVRACYATSMTNIEIALERIERFVKRIS